MKKKLTIALIITLLILGSLATLAEASTSTTLHEGITTTFASSPSAAIKCRTDSYETTAANVLGQKLYLYHLDVSWCYDGTKAWVTGKSSYGQAKYPFVSYKGDKITILNNKTRYFTITGVGTFRAAVGIPTPWGTFGVNREAHPVIKITGYYYGNVGKSQIPF